MIVLHFSLLQIRMLHLHTLGRTDIKHIFVGVQQLRFVGVQQVRLLDASGHSVNL